MENKEDAFNIKEKAAIEESFNDLINIYKNSSHRNKIKKITDAFNFANKAHYGIKRQSGEPYILHPISVAKICCSYIGLGSTSICAALLHDVIEDTDYTIEDIKDLFGDKIAQLVDGLNKISGGILATQKDIQAENFRLLLLTMSEDIRVVLIKMADRLHNMQTLGALRPLKQRKISGETLYLYAPLANRLGLNKIKTELENLSFQYENPEKFSEIQNKIRDTKEERDAIYNTFIAPIKKKMDEIGYKYKIKDRVKSEYSIWNKMQTKKVKFEDIYDILAVRIIFETDTTKPLEIQQKEEKEKSWNIYSIITDIYNLHPGRIRDWISNPKENGYQALQITVMGPNADWIEVQIRSSRMDDVAEQGFAAHWKYKLGEYSSDKHLDEWIDQVKEILESPDPNSMDILDTIKMNLYSKEIFIFTPKGELKTIPAKATALDFAFYLHTEIGAHCIGAKVNHKLVPMSTELQSGDQVEILTSKNQTIKQEWLDIVTTPKAKSKLLNKFKKEHKGQINKGEEILIDFFVKNKIQIDHENTEKIRKHFKCKTKDDMLYQLAIEKIALDSSIKKIITKDKSKLSKFWKLRFGKTEKTIEKDNFTEHSQKITAKNIEQKFIIADCCQPLPGDEIIGVLDKDGSIRVHKINCINIIKLQVSGSSKLISANWALYKEHSFPATIVISGIDNLGIVSAISKIVSKELSVNMTKIEFAVKEGIFKGHIELSVHSTKDIKTLIQKIKKIKNVENVYRLENSVS